MKANVDTINYNIQNGGTCIYSSTYEDLNDGNANAYFLMNVNNHINVTLTWDKKDAESSLIFTNDIARYLRVSFDTDGGTPTPSSQDAIVPGTAATRPEDPEKEGYDFVGWSRQDKENNDFSNIITDTVFKAIWIPTNYNLKYVLNGGTRHQNNVDKTFTLNDEINFDSPTRQGYKFIGWFEDENFNNSISSIAKGTTHDVTVYAKWEPVNTSYYVEHWLNNGTSYSLKEKETLEALTDSEVTAELRNFPGYKENTNFSGRKNTGVVTADGNLVLRLFYDKEIYNINYVLNGGINNSDNPFSYNVEDEIIFKSPEREGYDFIGWYLDSEFNTEKPSIPKGSTGDITIYAKWVPKNGVPYKVEHYLETDNGQYKMEYEENLTGNYNENVTAVAKTFDGYEENLNHQQRIAEGRITADGKLVLRLFYDKKEYKIEYETYEGINDKSNPFKYKTGDAVEFKAPTKTGYVFKGWYEDSNFTTPKNKIENEIGDKKVYAKWEKRTDIPYKVEHYKETNNGQYELAVTDNLQGEFEAEVTATPKSYEGYVENTEHKERVEKGIVQLDGSLVLKLFYNKQKYTVKFNTDGGEPNPDNQIVYYAEKAVEPKNPSKSGYEFEGWYLDGKEYSFDTLIKNDIELVAKWKSNAKDNSVTNNNDKSSTTEQKNSKKPSALPKTGVRIGIIFAFSIVVIFGVYFYKKYFDIKFIK